MNRHRAKMIAEKISNETIQQMFDNAKREIKNWKQISIVNKGMTKGAAWNILASDFDVNAKYPVLAKTNMIREFGSFLPKEILSKHISKKPTYSGVKIIHQDPKF